MKNLIFTLFMLTGTITYAQDFYDVANVQTIEVTFAESNWDALMDAQKNGDEEYIQAQTVAINGVTFDSVGVKFKGNSSYNANQVKNPWHIELDTYKEQDYEGYTDIKLANVHNDPSFVRDVLGFQIIRQYMDAPLSNYANLYVNGNLIGLYTNTESISKKFVKSRFGSKNNAFFNCSPPDGAGPQSNDFPNLVYLGQDSTDYYDSYGIKSDGGWQELIDLCDTLTNNLTDIENILDVDRALWMIAFDNIIVNLDSYIGNFKQNYYLYRSDYNQFLPIVWDLNESFGVFSQTGTSNLNNNTAKQQMDHLLHSSDAEFPLVEQLLSVPMYKRMYLAHYKTILLENFDNDAYANAALAYQATIDASVQADANKFYTYNNFLDNIGSDVGGGGGGPMGGGRTIPGITNLMEGRTSYLLGLSDFTQTEPTIANITLSNTSPTVNETITISAAITNEQTVYLGYRNETTAPFTKVEMFDDGAHNDGAANDGTYGVDLTVNNSTMQYYIYAENSTIGMFSPQRAAHEYHTITATTSNATNSDLVINEFMASNDTTIADQDGEFEDWIELYNNTATSIDLEGYFLSDDATDLMLWAFPAGTTIEANGFLTIWADKDEDQLGLHANLKLSSSAETIYLVNAAGEIVDEVSYVDQTTDISYGRFPNGTGEFQAMFPTYNTTNSPNTDTSPCANSGGDADNDGVCEEDDCDDNDPNVGAKQTAGTACDDGDANTENDVIRTDGCSCGGTPIIGDLVINEFMASNDSTVTDPDGAYEDWIELYNNGSASIDLEGYTLSDDAMDLTQWAFPAGTVIEANGYLIVWADNDEDQSGLHANFKLSASEESIFLVNAAGEIVDEVSYVDQTADISYGRSPNGTGDFQALNPTFNAQNSVTTSTSTTDLATNAITVYPNPASESFYLEIKTDVYQERPVSIYDLSGKKVYQNTVLENIWVDTSNWPKGMYMVRVESVFVKLVIQ